MLLSGCTQFSAYEGSYYSPNGKKTMELESGGTGYTLVGNEKFSLLWEDPIVNRKTGLEDNTSYDYCYITYQNSGKTQTFFFDSEMKKDGLFTATIGDDGLPILMLVGVKK